MAMRTTLRGVTLGRSASFQSVVSRPWLSFCGARWKGSTAQPVTPAADSAKDASPGAAAAAEREAVKSVDAGKALPVSFEVSHCFVEGGEKSRRVY